MTEKKTDPAKIRLKNVRLSFPALWSPKPPKEGSGGKPSYQSNFLVLKKDKTNIALIEDAIDAAIEAYETKNPKSKRFPDLEDLDKNKCAYRDGENRRGEPLYEGYEGCMVVAARNTKRPGVVDADKSPLTEDDGKPYAGCYVNAIVRFWCQDTDGGALRCSLEAVQFLKDGEGFGAAPVDTDEEFDDESEGESRSSRRRGRGEDADEERPRRRGRDAEEDERPARRRDRDAEEDERPARRRDRDADEDDRPARRRDRDADEDDRSSRRRGRDLV